MNGRFTSLAARARVAVAVLAAAAIAASLLVGSTVARAAAHSSARFATAMTLYGVPAQVQYVDNQDDRARGAGHNPFGNYTLSSALPRTSESRYGPFAGDVAIVQYDLFSDATLKHKAGSSVMVCQFELEAATSCDAYLQLARGTLLGVAALQFGAPSFSLAVTGGTSAYRRMTGNIAVTQSQAARSNESLPPFATPRSLLVDAQKLELTLAPAPAGPSPSNGDLSIYTFPTHEQFVNNNDDEARGNAQNPLGSRQFPQCKGLPTRQQHQCAGTIIMKDAASLEAHNNGPYAGDQTEFSFNIYSDSARKTPIGTARLTCVYSFDKNGFCDVSYQLKAGTLFGGGMFSFDAQSFKLAITGGLGQYAGASGDVTAVSGSNHTQHLTFALT